MELIDIFKYIRILIEESKKRPKMYGTPDGLVSMWYWLDIIALFILNKEKTFTMGDFGAELDMGTMNFLTYVKKKENLQNEDDIYKRLVELREQYEKWFNEKLLKEAPSLTEYFE